MTEHNSDASDREAKPQSPADLQRWGGVYNRACWNMRSCNELPDPEIIYDPADPSPFCLEWHEGARPHLNAAAIPDSLTEREKEDYFQQCAEHEITHYKIFPFDIRTRAAMVDAVSKSLAGENIPRDHVPDYANNIVNLFGDIVIDTWRRDGYGKKTNSQTVEWWRREFMKYVKNLVDKKLEGEASQSVKIFHKAYESMWNTDLGVEALGLSRHEVEAAERVAEVLGKDYRDSGLWYDKIGEFSKVIGPVMRKDALREQQRLQNQQMKQDQSMKGNMGLPVDGSGGQGGSPGKEQEEKEPGFGRGEIIKRILKKLKGDEKSKDQEGRRYAPPSIPVEGRGQGRPQRKSKQEEKKEGEGAGCKCSDKKEYPNKAGLPIDIRAMVGTTPQMSEEEQAAYASEAFSRNENNYENFKVVMSAAGIQEGELKRYWYRVKAANLMEVKPTQKGRGRPRRTYFGKWNIGDSVEELDVQKSLSISPEMIPGRTTLKERTRMVRKGHKVYVARPDLLIIRDSSGSMAFDKKYESANVGAFAALDLAGKHGARVAALDFSATYADPYPEELHTEWTTNYMRAENVFLAKEEANGGTILPSGTMTQILKKNKDPVFTVLITDAEIDELNSQISEETNEFIRTATSRGNKLALLHIVKYPAKNALTQLIEESGGQIKTIKDPTDVFGTILGSVSEVYEEQDSEEEEQETNA